MVMATTGSAISAGATRRTGSRYMIFGRDGAVHHEYMVDAGDMATEEVTIGDLDGDGGPTLPRRDGGHPDVKILNRDEP